MLYLYTAVYRITQKAIQYLHLRTAYIVLSINAYVQFSVGFNLLIRFAKINFVCVQSKPTIVLTNKSYYFYFRTLFCRIFRIVL